MINFQSAKLNTAAIHKIPKNEGISHPNYSHKPVENLEKLEQSIFNMLQSKFKIPTFYSFDYHNNDVILNPVYNYISNTFDDESIFLENSVKSAKLLFEKSKNTFIEGGYFVYALIKDILIEDELVDAIVIIKLEDKTNIITLELNQENIIDVIEQSGYSFEKPHKVCLVFNTNREDGFKVLQIDPQNKTDAEYWFNDFLFLKPYDDKHRFTSDYIKLAVNFAKKSESFKENDTVNKVEFINKTKKYFTENEHFEEENFLNEVLENNNKREDFKTYKSSYEDNQNKTITSNFEISETMVYKNSKILKSIIKLDKNFHIYVHGDRKKIERCLEVDGTKYYKLYFENEN